MIVWINGAFGSGKTTAAFELNRRLPGSFVYDPENVGYFIRRNAPAAFSGGDFQDFPLWRDMNYKMLSMITAEFDGTIIVPMTLVNPDYYAEIIGRLTADGADVRHFILYASRDEIKRRLRKRLSSLRGGDTFALNSIDRCLHAFDNLITETKIDTDNLSVDGVVEKIAELCGLTLTPDNASAFRKALRRAGVLLKHIR